MMVHHSLNEDTSAVVCSCILMFLDVDSLFVFYTPGTSDPHVKVFLTRLMFLLYHAHAASHVHSSSLCVLIKFNKSLEL